jgi:ADP-dependent NAD(P)H-hydrate dehydratase / NAD(P)H-hydrate epimerase
MAAAVWTAPNLNPVKAVLTATEYRRVDQGYQGDLATAMERAGHAVALAAARHGAGYGARVVVLAGPGNNGGDGYVAARHLKQRGAHVTVQRLGPPTSEISKSAARSARDAGVGITPMGPPIDCDLIIDAVFGGGGRQGLPEGLSAWMDLDTPVIAVDFPTGLHPDTGKVAEKAFRAVETVTFSTLKTGHVSEVGLDHCGVVTVADIGIDGGRPSLFVAGLDDAVKPARERSAHKWSAGTVLVIGGSEGMTGAAVLTARAALNFGAGAVYLCTPQPSEAHLAAPEIPSFSSDVVGPMLERFDVVVAGPGLAPGESHNFLGLVEKARHVVLDAGGLNPDFLEAALSGDSEVVVTPHSAEFKRLAGVGGGKFAARSYAGRKGLTVLLKGNPTLVTDGGPPILVMEGGPELATIGTGDVLSGMIGALWARGLDPLTAAISGAFWHGTVAREMAGEGTVTAASLVERIRAHAW